MSPDTNQIHPTSPAGGHPGTSSDALRSHYDIGTDFFGLWLDPSLTYSCALYEAGDTDDPAGFLAAQTRKLDFHIDQAHAAGAERVLDIGCGWGSMMRRLAERGAGHVTGMTMTEAHRTHVTSFGDPRLEVALTPWAGSSPRRPMTRSCRWRPSNISPGWTRPRRRRRPAIAPSSNAPIPG